LQAATAKWSVAFKLGSVRLDDVRPNVSDSGHPQRLGKVGVEDAGFLVDGLDGDEGGASGNFRREALP
jgi:hypothetical protein